MGSIAAVEVRDVDADEEILLVHLVTAGSTPTVIVSTSAGLLKGRSEMAKTKDPINNPIMMSPGVTVPVRPKIGIAIMMIP